jgi:hypothetical protein
MEGWKMDWKENGRCIHDITLTYQKKKKWKMYTTRCSFLLQVLLIFFYHFKYFMNIRLTFHSLASFSLIRQVYYLSKKFSFLYIIFVSKFVLLL